MPSAPGAREAGEKSAGGVSRSACLSGRRERVARRVVTGPIFQGADMGGSFFSLLRFSILASQKEK